MESNRPKFTKWVACWGNATSITDRKECVYARDLTLRYPVRMCFDGSRLRLRLSNLTGTEPVRIAKIRVAHQCTADSDAYRPVAVTFGGRCGDGVEIAPGTEVTSDEIAFDVTAGETIDVSLYLADFTQMNAGTLITGPLSKGRYSYGDFADSAELPIEKTRSTQWFYFLNTIDVLTADENRAIICYGDSITAQSWPDYLSQRIWDAGVRNVSVVRRAVSGTRILRQYDCITYQAYGLKGATRFPIEVNVAGASDIVIQHGINDIIHPVGVEVNPFRPWSDLPTVGEMTSAFEQLYVRPSRELGLHVWSGTLLPIFGWRTYNAMREQMRGEFNEWLRTSPIFDGCIDFDRALSDEHRPEAFAAGFDSGDHLHPSEAAYDVMAQCCFGALRAATRL